MCRLLFNNTSHGLHLPMPDPIEFKNLKSAWILMIMLKTYHPIFCSSLFSDVMILAVGGGEGMVALMEIDFRGKRDVDGVGWGGG